VGEKRVTKASLIEERKVKMTVRIARELKEVAGCCLANRKGSPLIYPSPLLSANGPAPQQRMRGEEPKKYGVLGRGRD